MRALRLLSLGLVLLAPAAGSAVAAPAVNGVFDLPGVQTNGQLTVAPDGNVWISLEGSVGRVAPDGTAVALAGADLGNQVGFPTGGIAAADGFIWLSQTPGGGKEAIAKIPPAAPATTTGVAVPGIDGGATAMALGPDGNIWVGLAGKLIRFSPANPPGATTFLVSGLAPKAITAASDGTLWVTDTANGGRLLNVTTAGVVTPYPVGGQPQFVGAGPNGQIAYGNPNNTPQQIGLLSPGGSPLTLERPAGSDPFGVAFGGDGAYWVAEFAGNRLARVTTDGQLTTLDGFPAVTGQGPRQLTAAPGNTLWVTLDKPGDPAATKIARVSGVEPPPPPAQDPPPGDPPPTGGDPPAGAAPPPDTTTPLVTGARLSRARLAAGTRNVVLRFTLSEPATVQVRLSRRAAGRRRGRACVRPTPRLRRARRCTRLVRVRSVSAAGAAGLNAIRIATRRLAPGTYAVAVTVVDAAGNRAAPVTRRFTVTRKRAPGT